MTQFVPKQWKAMRQWLTTPLGEAFLMAEARYVEKSSKTLFGLHLLLLGEPQFGLGVLKNPISHRVWVHPKVSENSGNSKEPGISDNLSAVSGRQDKLPILSDEIDLVYLAHCLEYLPNPHEVLREANRVLRPEGHVIISLFNPFSLWNLWRGLLHFIKPVAWDGRLISMMRIKDWLSLLGFDVVETKRYFFQLPINHPSFLKHFAWLIAWLEKFGQFFLPFGGASYIVVAKKRVLTLTPIKQPIKERKSVITPGLIEPVTRSK